MQEGAKTYDHWTREIQQSRGTTYRDQYYRATGTCTLLDMEPEGICKYGGCPDEEDGDGAMNITQGCI